MMKFTTRSRYGLRMMIEIARMTQNGELAQLPKIAKITALSKNYLEQLAMSLKQAGLLIGIPGKNGGYKLGRAPGRIHLKEILEAVDGPIGLTDCVHNPENCLNNSFCEARTIWVIMSGVLADALARYTLLDLIDKGRYSRLKAAHQHLYFLDSDRVVEEKMQGKLRACAMVEFPEVKKTQS